MKNEVAHIEWSSTDIERTKTFLSELFGWKFTPWKGNEDYLCSAPANGVNVGIRRVDPGIGLEPGNSPIVYVEVDEIDSYLEKARKLGGRVVSMKTPISGLGWIAYFADPDRNLVGLVQKP
jgi:predicted enzyme related to lactoylglutathione lyase